MVARTGTASQVDGSAGNGSTTVTVPADANLAVVFWAHWNDAPGSTMSSLTLNGVGFSIQTQLAEGSGGALAKSGIGVAILENPATGSQTFAWNWSANTARAEGGEIAIVYVKDANIGDAVHDSDANAAEGADDPAITIDSASTDLVLVFGQRFNGGSFSINGVATTFIDDVVVNNHKYDVAEATAGASSNTFNLGGSSVDYSSLAAISLKQFTAPVEVPKPLLAEHPYEDEYDEGFTLSTLIEQPFSADPVFGEDTFVIFEQPFNLELDLPPDDPPPPPDITHWLESFFEVDPWYDEGVFETLYDTELPEDAIEARFELDPVFDPGYIDEPTVDPPVNDLTEIPVNLEARFELDDEYDDTPWENYLFLDIPLPPEPEPEPEPEPPPPRRRKPGMIVRVTHLQRPPGGFNTKYHVDDE